MSLGFFNITRNIGIFHVSCYCVVYSENTFFQQTIPTRKFPYSRRQISNRIGDDLKLLRESTNADRSQLKIAFSSANCRFRLPVCYLERCFNAYRFVHECHLSGVNIGIFLCSVLI